MVIWLFSMKFQLRGSESSEVQISWQQYQSRNFTLINFYKNFTSLYLKLQRKELCIVFKPGGSTFFIWEGEPCNFLLFRQANLCDFYFILGQFFGRGCLPPPIPTLNKICSSDKPS